MLDQQQLAVNTPPDSRCETAAFTSAAFAPSGGTPLILSTMVPTPVLSEVPEQQPVEAQKETTVHGTTPSSCPPLWLLLVVIAAAFFLMRRS